jgi:hypothetical protein
MEMRRTAQTQLNKKIVKNESAPYGASIGNQTYLYLLVSMATLCKLDFNMAFSLWVV